MGNLPTYMGAGAVRAISLPSRPRRDRSLPGRTDHPDIAIFAYFAFRTRVVIAAAVLELSDRVDVVAADANNPADLLRRQNPLGKISTLILEDGRAPCTAA
jgi:hypothetical protein